MKVSSPDLRLLFTLVSCVAVLSVLVKGQQKTGKDLIVVESENQEDNDEEVSVSDDVEELTEEVFVPKTEWQEVKKGQAIPRGLHVRLNLQTGKREAKLIEKDKEEKKTDEKQTGDVNRVTNGKQYSREELVEAMKHFTSDDVKDPEKMKNAERTFKSMDQIKKEFQDLKINVKTDYEILRELVVALRDTKNDDERIMLLNDLEYYVHQYDNAQDFVQMGGLQLVIPALNSSNEAVRASSAFLLGSAMQSNPKVQIAALENTLLQQLVKIIVHDDSWIVQARTIYAVSCLVRHFPLAQQQLIQQGGLTALASVFRRSSHLSDMEASKLQLKAVTLLTDLVEEQQLTAKNLSPEDEIELEKLRQYKRANLERAMAEQGWCDYVPRLLDAVELDVREKVVKAMKTIVSQCRPEFHHHVPALRRLLHEYQILSQTEASVPGEMSDTYFDEMRRKVEALLFDISPDSSKDEL